MSSTQGQFNGPVTNTCAFKKRKAGILIPQCPPGTELQINGEADYYLWANFSREPYKATYDLLFFNGGRFSTRNIFFIVSSTGDFIVDSDGDNIVGLEEKS
jgi:hypothetical protein